MEERYHLLQEEPAIVPKMVVVHWTVIPTFEKSYQAFYGSRLPGARAEIATASALNVSSQYLIDRNGKIYQLLPDTVFARHVIGLNHCAIGIENVGGGKDLPLTKAQLRSNIALIRRLLEKHDIDYVIGHHEYQQFIGHPLWRETDPEYLTRKSDPGDAFMQAIRDELSDYDLQPLPTMEEALAKKEIEILRKRLIEDALQRQGFAQQISHYIEPDYGKAAGYLQQMQPDGRWPDVDYTDRDNEWAPLRALNRILIMTYAYSQPTDPLYHDAGLLAGITHALKYWYTVNPTCRNWYKNDIAKQFYLNVIALLLQDFIDADLLHKMVADLTDEPSMTGSNRTLVSISVIYRGVLEKNGDRIRQGVVGVMDQIAITTKEGIQPDFSFHQHGPFIYNGSYGHNFLRETIWLASVVQGTPFAFGEEQMKILRDYFLEGTRWMVRKQLFDYNVRGRQVGRSSGFGLAAEKIVPQLDRFILADPEHAAAYEDVRQRILQNRPQDINGNRHFWRSDYTAHQRPAYFTSLKMCSARTVGMEMDVNSENLYGFYLPYGLTYIYRHGDEYEDIFPVWDWARLPGVTSPHQEFSSKGKSTQQTTFVGGVSDGRYGLSAMDLDIQHTRAKKTWFWFDDEWVALGAGIASDHEAPIITGVNQSHLRGPVIIDGKAFHRGQQTLTDPTWVWHDSIAYVFPNEQNVVLKAEEQSGDLRRIFGLGADTTYRSPVFSLWFDHGRQPKSDSYYYIVVPGRDHREMAAYTEKLPVRVLANTPAIQAVAHDTLGLIGIAFHTAGECAVARNLTVKADQPCLLLVDRKKKRLTVCDPTALLENIRLSFKNDQGEERTVELPLPVSGFAGGSVSVSLP